jgi:hypothetical protein
MRHTAQGCYLPRRQCKQGVLPSKADLKEALDDCSAADAARRVWAEGVGNAAGDLVGPPVFDWPPLAQKRLGAPPEVVPLGFLT